MKVQTKIGSKELALMHDKKYHDGWFRHLTREKASTINHTLDHQDVFGVVS